MSQEAVPTAVHAVKAQQQRGGSATTPSWQSIVQAYHREGNGDRDMLIALLNAKAKEDERLAAIDVLRAEQLRAYNNYVQACIQMDPAVVQQYQQYLEHYQHPQPHAHPSHSIPFNATSPSPSSPVSSCSRQSSSEPTPSSSSASSCTESNGTKDTSASVSPRSPSSARMGVVGQLKRRRGQEEDGLFREQSATVRADKMKRMRTTSSASTSSARTTVTAPHDHSVREPQPEREQYKIASTTTSSKTSLRYLLNDQLSTFSSVMTSSHESEPTSSIRHATSDVRGSL
ncbi:hypothetical protein EMMF5_001386 [Cystobasidiomycetes sp. EMM_F5]